MLKIINKWGNVIAPSLQIVKRACDHLVFKLQKWNLNLGLTLKPRFFTVVFFPPMWYKNLKSVALVMSLWMNRSYQLLSLGNNLLFDPYLLLMSPSDFTHFSKNSFKWTNFQLSQKNMLVKWNFSKTDIIENKIANFDCKSIK